MNSFKVSLLLLSFEGVVSGSEGPGPSPTSPSPQLEEMDARLLEFEADPPNWREMAPPEELASLGKKETKRQEVINGECGKEMLLSKVSTLYVHFCIFPCLLLHPELFATEHAHVRMLSVLQTVFSKPLEREELLSSTDVATIFPSLDEIIDVHCKCKSMNSITSLYPSSCKIKTKTKTPSPVVSKERKSGTSFIWSSFVFACHSR